MDFVDFLILGSFILVPAIIFVIIFELMQRRSRKFHRQRITKGQKSRSK